MEMDKQSGNPGGGQLQFITRYLSRPVRTVRCENCEFFNRAAWIKGEMNLCHNPENRNGFIPPGADLPCFVRKGSRQEVEIYGTK